MPRPESVSNYNEIDKPQDKCAVVGIVSFAGRDVSGDTILSLYKQQNRGQGGSGVATLDLYGGDFKSYKNVGLVSDVYQSEKIRGLSLNGSLVTGHNRYATSGTKDKPEGEKINSLQPYVVKHNRRSLALSHNGNIPEKYLSELREKLPQDVALQSDTDSEVVAWTIMHAEGESWKDKIKNGLSGVKGAYSFVIATDEGDLFGIKDPLGIRPLVFARTSDGAAIVSETHGLEDMKGVHDRRELDGGEMVHITLDGQVEFERIFPETKAARCIVEPIYLRHPNSREGNFEVSEVRFRMGEQLAREFKVAEDVVVVGIPDSGLEIAKGYSEESGRKSRSTLIIKDRYRAGIRSFIEDTQQDRLATLRKKFSVSERVAGMKVILIDDSLIRGNTTSVLIEQFRENGALEVHVALGSPMFVDTCGLGVDIASLDELKALKKEGFDYKTKTSEEIAEEIGADSVHFLSLDGLIGSIDGKPLDFCTKCLTGIDPIVQLGEAADYVYTAKLPQHSYPKNS